MVKQLTQFFLHNVKVLTHQHDVVYYMIITDGIEDSLDNLQYLQ